MSTPTGQTVPYDKTAQRPGLHALPPAVTASVEAELGAPIVSAASAGGGFTSGFASLVTAANGRELFVKAAGPDTPIIHRSYTRERQINAALPAGLPAPRLEFAAEVEEWVVLGFEAVRGKAPALPMGPGELDVMLDAWARAAELLVPVSEAFRAAGIRTLYEDAGDQFLGFTAMAAGDEPVVELPAYALSRLDVLASLEQGLHPAVAADAVTHGDLRPDNMILAGDRALICDWNWPAAAAPWFDTVFLLITAYGDGHDAEKLFFAHPTAAGVTGDQLDAVLAGAAGYYLSRARQEPFPGVSTFLRQHQRWCGEAALAWLAARRGW